VLPILYYKDEGWCVLFMSGVLGTETVWSHKSCDATGAVVSQVLLWSHKSCGVTGDVVS
jgi:hypothetical protein